MKPRITLTKGLFALVDDCDMPIVDQWYWTSCFGQGDHIMLFADKTG